MTNIGSETWGGSTIELDQANPVNFWWPDNGVGLGGSSVDLNESKTFSFNLKTLEPEFCGNQSNYWKMHRNGSPFGASNGRTTFVDNCPGASLNPLKILWALLEPAVRPELLPRVASGWLLDVGRCGRLCRRLLPDRLPRLRLDRRDLRVGARGGLASHDHPVPWRAQSSR